MNEQFVCKCEERMPGSNYNLRHVITDDVEVAKDKGLMDILKFGTKYIPPNNKNFNNMKNAFYYELDKFIYGIGINKIQHANSSFRAVEILHY